MHNPFQQAHYSCSVHRLPQLPADTGAEVAFCGRSNAGKSSVINVITAQKRLARSSKQPGRTQQLNFFTVSDDVRLVDLPGYGYARVPGALQRNWHKLINGYLEKRRSLAGMILIVDIRRGLNEQDLQLVSWCRTCQLPVHVLLNKADKLSYGRARTALLTAEKQLPGDCSCQLFSVMKKTGLEQCRQVLADWLYAGHGDSQGTG